MAKEAIYGVISDVHNDPRIVPLAIGVLKKLGAQRLLINGDIGNHQKTLQDSQNYVAFILDAVGRSGLESFVQPGSHEPLLAYIPVVEHFSERYSNIVNVLKKQKAEVNGHDLVFLPGSDFTCGGEFQIGNDSQIPSGRYIQTQDGLVEFEDLGQYVGALQRRIAQGAFQYINIRDLRKLVSNPEKTVLICHVPRKFHNLETCVDVAEFGEASADFMFGRDEVKMGSVFPIQVAPKIAQEGYPVVLRKENRGNEDLKNICNEIGIKKAISGHFHESSHRANDSNSLHVDEGKLVEELYWNAGCLDMGCAGLLSVSGERVKYQNVRLQDYIK